MAKSAGKGSIIVNSSIAGSRVSYTGGNLGHKGVYAASKAGAEMLMKYAAIEASVTNSTVFPPSRLQCQILNGLRGVKYSATVCWVYKVFIQTRFLMVYHMDNFLVY